MSLSFLEPQMVFELPLQLQHSSHARMLENLEQIIVSNMIGDMRFPQLVFTYIQQQNTCSTVSEAGKMNKQS